VPYKTPDPDVVAIIDAAPTPVALLGPGGRFVVLVHYEAHPPVAQLAKPYLPLAGIRIDLELGARQRVRRLTQLSLLRLDDRTQRPVTLPDGARPSAPAWAPDGRKFAFTVDEADGVGVWVADAETATARQVPGLRVRDVLGGDPLTVGAAVRWSRDGGSLLALGVPPAQTRFAPGQFAQPELAQPEPRAEETAGKRSQMATYQDLLRTADDADLFEVLATSVPLRVEPSTGAAKELGPPGLYQRLTDSPDGEYLLVHRLRRPFSFRVPYQYFARNVEVWSADGDLQRVVAELPVSDEIPRQGVPAGPRAVSWEERAPASLVWAEALDGGDPVAPAEHRDRVMRLAAPFTAEPEQALLVKNRCLGWLDMDEPDRVLLTEHDRDRRWLTTWLHNLAKPGQARVIFDHSMDDAYTDPGSPLTIVHANGTRTILQHGPAIYLRGDGSTPDGDRPFLDRLDLETSQKSRLYQSPADGLDHVIGFPAGSLRPQPGAGPEEVVLWHESQAEPPNLFLAALNGSGRTALTSWPDPHPQITGLRKQLLVHDRGDGVQLSGMLHLPPGYDPATDGRLPLLIWAYPLDFGDASTAGQVRGSSSRFTRLGAMEPTWFVLRGYAVLSAATMPVIGDPETMNDTYVEQVTAAARAHIRALDEMGIADPARVAVGGHSYGGFMTANLLAHTDLFAAGIARSGAYNRTLTPFGFQTERRSFWEAPAVYDQVSAFRYADQITAPLLLIHGADDNNSGTFPIQSERLYQAIQGLGGTARLVILPHESHGYIGRESVLHMLAEQFDWLDRWVS
jgi:dipeptidyl aminopeptidase/acylaminoacyl peptidase